MWPITPCSVWPRPISCFQQFATGLFELPVSHAKVPNLAACVAAVSWVAFTSGCWMARRRKRLAA